MAGSYKPTGPGLTSLVNTLTSHTGFQAGVTDRRIHQQTHKHTDREANGMIKKDTQTDKHSTLTQQ